MPSATGSRRASPSSGRGRTTATTSSLRVSPQSGWTELWAGEELLGATVAGGIELGRAAAPVCLIDEATLGAPLWVDGRARHARETRVARGASSWRRPRARPASDRGQAGAHARRQRHRARRVERARRARVGRGRCVLACVERGDARLLRRARVRDRSSSRSSTRARGSSSARRWPPPGRAVTPRRRSARDGRDDASRVGCGDERRRPSGAGAPLGRERRAAT